MSSIPSNEEREHSPIPSSIPSEEERELLHDFGGHEPEDLEALLMALRQEWSSRLGGKEK